VLARSAHVVVLLGRQEAQAVLQRLYYYASVQPQPQHHSAWELALSLCSHWHRHVELKKSLGLEIQDPQPVKLVISRTKALMALVQMRLQLACILSKGVAGRRWWLHGLLMALESRRMPQDDGDYYAQ
jgi:hypothetical protein